MNYTMYVPTKVYVQFVHLYSQKTSLKNWGGGCFYPRGGGRGGICPGAIVRGAVCPRGNWPDTIFFFYPKH